MHSVLASIPVPPQEEMPDAQWWFTAWLGVPLAVMFALAIRKLMEGEGPLLLCCLIGGAFASLWEAPVNVLGTMVYAEDGIWTAYEMLGRKIPILIPLAYSWFVGGQAYYCFKYFEKGITYPRILKLWGTLFLVNVVIETPGLLAGVYEYYGNQPWDFWGFPFWYGWANPLAPMIGAAAILRLRPSFEGAIGQLAAIPIVFMSFGIGYAAISLPLWWTLNDDSLGYEFTYGASIITFGLALFVLKIVSIVVGPPRGEPASLVVEPERAEEPALVA